MQFSHHMLFFAVPSSPREFTPTCSIVAWKVPSEINGVLKGYELQFQSEEKEIIETVYLGPIDTHYKTTGNLMEAKVEVRVCLSFIVGIRSSSYLLQVRANNTNNQGTWTRFYSNGMFKLQSNNFGLQHLSLLRL